MALHAQSRRCSEPSAPQGTRSDTQTYCPYKGDASYFSVLTGGERSINAIWTYETLFKSVADIGRYLAFYPDRVDSIEELAG
jgi:uncharacterized protein (DUF427 family)